MVTKSKTSKLKPCPFCGCGDGPYVSFLPTNDDDTNGGIAVVCPNCGAQGPVADTIAMARKCWNDRPDSGR